MRYPKESFFSNFSEAYKSKDNEIKGDLLNQELARLIVNNKRDLREGFKQVGINLPKKAKDSDYVDAIIKNGDDRRVNVMLAYYIAENNKKELGKQSSADGQDDSGAIIGDVTGAIGDVFGYLKTSKDAAAQEEASKNALMQSVLGYNNATATNGSGNTGWYVLGVLLIIGAIIGVWYYADKKGKPALGSGLEAKPVPTPPPVATPTV